MEVHLVLMHMEVRGRDQVATLALAAILAPQLQAEIVLTTRQVTRRLLMAIGMQVRLPMLTPV